MAQVQLNRRKYTSSHPGVDPASMVLGAISVLFGCQIRGRNEAGKGGAVSRAPSHYGGAKSLQERPMAAKVQKSPNNVTNTFFNAKHLLPKDISFEYWGAKLASYPGCHLTSLHPGVKSHNNLAAAREVKYISQHCCDKQWTRKWPDIANVVFRFVQNYGE